MPEGIAAKERKERRDESKISSLGFTSNWFIESGK
jgi:hypothetical protein